MTTATKRKLTGEERRTIERAGTRKEIAERIRSYSKAVTEASAEYERLVEEHPRQWVALSDGRKVMCLGATLETLLRKCERVGIRRDQVVIKYLDPDKRTMIL